jgi:hypothetical protein
MDNSEEIRQRLIAVRREFARRLADTPPMRDTAVFHCGVWGSGSVTRFVTTLRKNPRFAGAQTLEMLPAGKYLYNVTKNELEKSLSLDWNDRRTFSLEAGGEFSASINGMWRHLSALYAKQCSGRVHGLVAHDRARLHKNGLELWAKHRTASMLNQLKVWGFVEFPILVGALSKNKGVTAVDIYLEDVPGVFRLLESHPNT